MCKKTGDPHRPHLILWNNLVPSANGHGLHFSGKDDDKPVDFSGLFFSPCLKKQSHFNDLPSGYD